MKIGDTVYIRGTIDEIRKDVVIIRNKGGYFGTVLEEINTDIGDYKFELWLNSRNRAFNEVLEIIDKHAGHDGSDDYCDGYDVACLDIKQAVLALKGGEQE